MNYYTSTIPLPLAEKLKEKGMPIEKEGENTWCPSYAEVFDWLIRKGFFIEITTGVVCGKIKFLGRTIKYGVDITDLFDTWHEAAEAAIEKALDLI